MATVPHIPLQVRRDDGWVALAPAGPNVGFTELREAEFRIPEGQEGPEGCRLLVDDAPLDSRGSGVWVWEPGYYAGPVRAELLGPDGAVLGRWRFDVSPHPDKVAPEVFDGMVAEILDHDPELVLGTEPARHRLGALGEMDDPLVALERLRRREDALARAIAAIHREPRTVLRAKREWVPLHRVRRADLRTLRTALREPAVLAALPRTRPTEVAASPASSPFLDTPAAERRLDSPANRAALYMLRALRRRAGRVWERLRVEAEKGGKAATRTGFRTRLPRWEEILELMSRSFERAERKSPFRDARRPEITAAGLNAVAAHPVYAQFWRTGWEALRPGIHRDGADDLPLSPTGEIYERWCFVELARRLREWLPESDWRESRGRGAGDRRWVRFRRGDGAAVSLLLQKTARRDGADLRSVSAPFVPDLALLREGLTEGSGFVVLDAKYRASQEGIVSGMAESAHPYQDALRWDRKRPDATLLLVPDVTAASWLSDQPFVADNRVGAITLRPSAAPPEWFRDLLLGGILPEPGPTDAGVGPAVPAEAGAPGLRVIPEGGGRPAARLRRAVPV